MTGLKYRLLGLLVLPALSGPLHADQTYQQDWKPNRYELRCERPEGCLSAGHKHRVDMFLRQLTRFYEQSGWRAPEKFGPILSQRGEPAVQITDSPKRNLAFVTPACHQEHVSMSVGQGSRRWASQRHIFYYFLAHELFHVVQSAYPPFSHDPCRLAGWVKESTADAVGLDAMRRAFPARYEARTEREARKYAGLRRYDVSLDQTFRDFDGSLMGTGASMYYATSSFWRHLAETYHDGSFGYIGRFFRVRPDNWDWLGWLHRRLLVEPRIQAALGPVYALFVADYAGWGERGGHGEYFGSEKWLARSFGGCRRIHLSPEQPETRLTMSLRRTSAKCVEARVSGIRPGQRVSVIPGVLREPAATKLVDQIHVSLAASTDRTKFSCSRAIRSADDKTRLEGMGRCVLLPSTGEATIGDNRHAARIWDVLPQQVRRGGSFENRYLVSRVSPSPTEVHPPEDDGGEVMELEMVFVLDTEDLSVEGQRPAGNERAVGTLNLDPGTQTRAAVPKHGPGGTPRAPATSSLSPRPAAPGLSNLIPLPRGAEPSGILSGIFRLSLTWLTTDGGGIWEAPAGLSPGDVFSFMPVAGKDSMTSRSLEIGDTGTFPALLSGRWRGRGLTSPETGTIEVKEFSPWVLRAELSGTFCEMMKMSGENPCPNPVPVRGTIVKAFAGLHVPGSTFVVQDTEGVRQYRSATDHWRSALLSEKAGSPADGGQDGAAGGLSAGGGEACTCSCSDLEDLLGQSAEPQERYESGESALAIAPAAQKMMRCAQQCALFYARCAQDTDAERKARAEAQERAARQQAENRARARRHEDAARRAAERIERDLERMLRGE